MNINVLHYFMLLTKHFLMNTKAYLSTWVLRLADNRDIGIQ